MLQLEGAVSHFLARLSHHPPAPDQVGDCLVSSGPPWVAGEVNEVTRRLVVPNRNMMRTSFSLVILDGQIEEPPLRT